MSADSETPTTTLDTGTIDTAKDDLKIFEPEAEKKDEESIAHHGAEEAGDDVDPVLAELVSTTEPTKGTFIEETISFFKTLAVFLAAAFLLKASVVEAFKIPSGSMLPTLQIGDQILVSKFSYGLRIPLRNETIFDFAAPQRGDVVVFTRPDDASTPNEDESSINIIKRVVGLPGDTIEVRGTRVFINNQPYLEPYARWELGGIREGNFGPDKVPPGHVLLLGDNRDHSRDSRFWDSPFLPINRIKGRALMIYWSWEDLARMGKIIR